MFALVNLSVIANPRPLASSAPSYLTYDTGAAKTASVSVIIHRITTTVLLHLAMNQPSHPGKHVARIGARIRELCTAVELGIFRVTIF